MPLIQQSTDSLFLPQGFSENIFFSRFTLAPCATSQAIEELLQSTYGTNKRITNDNSKIDSCTLNSVNDGGSLFLSSIDFSFRSYCPCKKNGIFVFLFADLLFPRHFLKHLNIVEDPVVGGYSHLKRTGLLVKP